MKTFPFLKFAFYLVCHKPYFMNINIYPPSFEGCSESFIKGYLFEEYIRKLFNDRNFKVLDWRNSLVAGNKQLPRSYFALPDLELLFVRDKIYRFAVECKWRQHSYPGAKIDWARENEIQTYVRYQQEQNIRVFVAIGIGGEPSNPEKLFVTPLDHTALKLRNVI
jgi:hypothetical protein